MKQFWHSPQRAGITSPEELRSAAIEYFDWATSANLREAKAFAFQGSSWVEDIDKARAFTFKGMCIFIGVSTHKVRKLADDPEYAEVLAWIDDVIFTQKFELAAAELLNANFISKDLGLVDKSEISGAGGGPLRTVVQYQLPSNGRDQSDEESEE